MGYVENYFNVYWSKQKHKKNSAFEAPQYLALDWNDSWNTEKNDEIQLFYQFPYY